MKDAAEREDLARPVDRAEEATLALALGNTPVGKVEAEGAHDREQDAQEGADPLDAAPEPRDLGDEVLLGKHRARNGDDARAAAAEPACGRGPGNARARREREVAGGPDELV